MKVQTEIERKLSDALEPLHMEVINESHMHSVPPGSESHFKVIVVSARFNGKALIQRHRAINELLASEIAGPVHALSLHTLTPDEWFDDKGGRVDASPPCLGGSKADQ